MTRNLTPFERTGCYEASRLSGLRPGDRHERGPGLDGTHVPRLPRSREGTVGSSASPAWKPLPTSLDIWEAPFRQGSQPEQRPQEPWRRVARRVHEAPHQLNQMDCEQDFKDVHP